MVGHHRGRRRRWNRAAALRAGRLLHLGRAFLVAAAAGCVLLAPKPRESLPRSVLPLGLFAVGVYDGYFGAASG